MKNSPSQQEMMSPTNAQSGAPNYAAAPESTFYPNRGDDAPAYVASNPRYWEYR
jgi:hypothetical protein